jgi:hypothetical protein
MSSYVSVLAGGAVANRFDVPARRTRPSPLTLTLTLALALALTLILILILTEDHDRLVTTILIDRRAKLNALTLDMLAALETARSSSGASSGHDLR